MRFAFAMTRLDATESYAHPLRTVMIGSKFLQVVGDLRETKTWARYPESNVLFKFIPGRDVLKVRFVSSGR